MRERKGARENIYIHRFLRSGCEAMHSHPWPMETCVLRGRFVERTREGLFERRKGDVIVRGIDDVHAIAEVEPGTITMSITGPRLGEWQVYAGGRH